MSVSSEAFDLYTLADGGVQSVAFSPDETLLYAAMDNGKIEVFDVATHTLLNTWKVGKELGALNVSPDGSFMLVAELEGNGTSKVYKVDTATGAVVSAHEAGGPFIDLQIVDSHTAILTGGQDQVTMLDLDTMTYSSMDGAISYSNSSILSHDGHYTLFAETGISDGPLFLYDDRVGQIVASGDDYQHGSGFNFGIQAVSEKAGQVAQFIYYGSLYIYDLTLTFQREVDLGGRADGLTYDATGKYAFVYLIDEGVVAKFETEHWHRVADYAVGVEDWNNFDGYGDQLMVDATDSYITVLNSDGTGKLQLIDLSSQNADYHGSKGADAFAGGDGNDSYLVNNAGDTITEKANGGRDQATASLDYVLAANVEDLMLKGAAVSGGGNEEDNLITGSKLANLLDGAGGDDELFGARGEDSLAGGLGDDILHGGQGADTLDGGDGADTASYADAKHGVRVDLGLAGAQDTKGGGADTLVGIENLTGSASNDILRGDVGSNALDGGAGDDILIGGENGDRLTGGAGADTFRYLATADSNASVADFIVDLTRADRIDLKAIDADTNTLGDQAFNLVDSFTGHAAEAVLDYDQQRYVTTLSLDVDGDGHADMVIHLAGDQTAFTNFVL